MPRPPARAGVARTALATVAVAVAATALGACSDEGSSDAFCTRLEDTPDLAAILSSVDAGDPAGTEDALREGVRHYRALEADAPGEIRADVARIRQGVELVLDAVEDNPDDLPGAREAITAQTDELAGLAQSGQRVASYAARECDIDLVPGDGGAGDTGTGDDLPPTTDG